MTREGETYYCHVFMVDDIVSVKDHLPIYLYSMVFLIFDLSFINIFSISAGFGQGDYPDVGTGLRGGLSIGFVLPWHGEYGGIRE